MTPLAYTQRTYLKRLERLLRLRREYSYDLNHAGTRLLDRSIHATLCDCFDAGVYSEAFDIYQSKGALT